MNRTHLRYACSDAFGSLLSPPSISASSSSVPITYHYSPTTDSSASSRNFCILTQSISSLSCVDPRGGELVARILHRDDKTTYGPRRALNSDEISTFVSDSMTPPPSTDHSPTNSECLCACGYTDGFIRIFPTREQISNKLGRLNSLLDSDSETAENADVFTSCVPSVFRCGNTAMTSLAFSHPTAQITSSLLAGGDALGTIIVIDVTSSTGRFRFPNAHKGSVSKLHFVTLAESKTNLLISVGASDGLMKVWDLDAQACVQTIIVSEGGDEEVWGCDVCELEERGEFRIVVGSQSSRLRLYMIDGKESSDNIAEDEQQQQVYVKFMGQIERQPNTLQSPVSSIKFHPNDSNFFAVSTRAKGDNNTVEIYRVRGAAESKKKAARRERRKREKSAIKKRKTEGGTIDINKGKKSVMDDSEEEGEEEGGEGVDDTLNGGDVVTAIKAVDELDHYCSVKPSSSSFKTKGFAFAPFFERGGGMRIVLGGRNNALEIYSVNRSDEGAEASKITTLDMFGISAPVRSIAITSDDILAASVGKQSLKVWNVEGRSCIRSIQLSHYALCCKFLRNNTHLVVGTKEGILLCIDFASGEVTEEQGHEGAIWSLDVHESEEGPIVVTGGADSDVKFWMVERGDDNSSDDSDSSDDSNSSDDSEKNSNSNKLQLIHTRTLKMSDDVLSVKFSYSLEADKLLVFVASLDSTVKVFFHDTLKFFLSLYGHKLPVMALDCTDDDNKLISGGADKTIKIWGLDFGDCHRSLYGHEDSITSIVCVKKSHNFFSASKDKTVRYWDSDKFEQILLMGGHVAEIYSLSLSKSGGYLLSGGMDRSIRVWERTREMVFIEEEKETALEQQMNKKEDLEYSNSGSLGSHFVPGRLAEKGGSGLAVDVVSVGESELAVKKSVLSVAAGDRINEALELADGELAEILSTKKSNKARVARGEKEMPIRSNPLLLGMEPARYVLWVLRSVNVADLEQALMILPLIKVERLIFYLIYLIKSNLGVELCGKIAVFLVKVHQKQIIANNTLLQPLMELRGLLKIKLSAARSLIGRNNSAMKLIAKIIRERQSEKDFGNDVTATDIWGELGIGSDVAAALQKKTNSKRKR